MNFGILYTATGTHYRKEAIRSATTAKHRMPEVPIAIHTDLPEVALGALFDIKRKIDEPRYHFIDKVLPLNQSPFEKNLVLRHRYGPCWNSVRARPAPRQVRTSLLSLPVQGFDGF